MLAHAHFQNLEVNEAEVFAKLQLQIINRYNVDPQLASEMAWDLMEIMSAVDGNMEIFEKYFLH